MSVIWNKQSKRAMVLGALLLVATAGIFVGASIGDGTRPPDRPPWIGEDYVADVSRMPDRLPVVGSNGDQVGWVNVVKGDGSGRLHRDENGRIPVHNDDGVIVGYFGAVDEQTKGQVFESIRN